MFDTLADVPQVGVALGLLGAALFGIATDLPQTPAPDATAPAATVDRVAASTHPTTAAHPVTATAVKIGPRELALRNGGGTARATFAYGPVTPAPETGPLRRVLRGVPPDRAFEDPEALQRAAAARRRQPPRWRTAGDELRVRHVTWGEIDVTLVGA